MEKKQELKIDRILIKIASIDSTLKAQHESLKEHMHRTELLEKRMEKAEKSTSMLSGALKALGSAGILALIGRFFRG